MEAVSKRERSKISRATAVSSLSVMQTTGEVPLGQGIQLRIKFSLTGGLVRAFSRETWQAAYESHDTSLRILYWVKVRKKGGVFGSDVAEPMKYLKKASLYWTRNPDLTDNVTNKIWAMVIDEEKVPHIFDSEDKVREALFDFDRRVLVPASALKEGREAWVVEVKVKWGRHTFVEKGTAMAASEPLIVKR